LISFNKALYSLYALTSYEPSSLMEAYKAVLISFNLLMANETDLGLKVMVNSTKASIGFSLANLANYSLISDN